MGAEAHVVGEVPERYQWQGEGRPIWCLGRVWMLLPFGAHGVTLGRESREEKEQSQLCSGRGIVARSGG